MTAPINENHSYNNSVCASAANTESLLYDYVNGETDEATTASVKAHLQTCAHCREEEQRIRKMMQTIKDCAPVLQGSLAKDVAQRIAGQNEAPLAPIAGGMTAASSQTMKNRRSVIFSRRTLQTIGAAAAAFAIVIGLVSLAPFLNKINDTTGTDADSKFPTYQSPADESPVDNVGETIVEESDKADIGGIDTSVGTSEIPDTRSEVETQNDYMYSEPSSEQSTPVFAPQAPEYDAPTTVPAEDAGVENENEEISAPDIAEPSETQQFVKAVLYVEPQNIDAVYDCLSKIDGIQIEESDRGLAVTPALAADTVFSVLDDAGLILQWSSLPFDTANMIRILWMEWIDVDTPIPPAPAEPDVQTGYEQPVNPTTPVAPDAPTVSDAMTEADVPVASDIPAVSVDEPTPSVEPEAPVELAPAEP